ncbi:GCN5 family acetyltransferase [Paenibacillus glacialis]|uniref:GCN5 family acetyltransferase n=2 Tax=Paenibacillus glacialis TaxID=494026 RepID=A0A168N8W8_9BACL|nr:GCN5 family acetyltransferase [Paenibacillus glacialis]
MGIQIVNLAEHKEYFETVCQWLWKQWASDKPIEFVRYAVLHNSQIDRVPMTFVALDGEEPVGTVSFWMNDLSCRQDLSPWLASLYVDEEQRGKGIARELQNRVIEEATKLGYSDLYLITTHDDYYERFGWNFIEKAPKLSGDFTKIYSKDLRSL